MRPESLADAIKVLDELVDNDGTNYEFQALEMIKEEINKCTNTEK